MCYNIQIKPFIIGHYYEEREASNMVHYNT
jgi:hypothetical protein